ncbi:hypothetical protein SAMN03159496_06515 [Rhizobium sp. NFR07]|nr:hypothetical protein SAMN03159496_06515 [Rhizobium sp. NFR07]
MNSEIINQWRRAPRLCAFAEFFEQTARGTANQPDMGKPYADEVLLGKDVDCLAFADTHRRLWGAFDNHYFASIPYRLEEECRLGAAILRFGLKAWAREARPAAVYTLGAGAGTLSRTLDRDRQLFLCHVPATPRASPQAVCRHRGEPIQEKPSLLLRDPVAPQSVQPYSRSHAEKPGRFLIEFH